MSTPATAPGADRASFAAAFAGRLRRAGLGASMTAVERAATALETVEPVRFDDLYWALRLSYVSDVDQLPIFDAVFIAVFDVEPGPPWATLPTIAPDDDTLDDHPSPAVQQATLAPRSSANDEVIDRPFDSLDNTELERIAGLLAATTEWPQRPSRRQRITRSGGPVALRPSIRRSLATGGDVIRLWRTQPTTRPRPVVMIVDVSGSMESYARAYLHLTRQLAIHRRAEVFAFATRLTRITPAVRRRSPDAAVEAANASVDDRFSGTRLASSLDQLVRHPTWSTMVRGAVVVICSDGWDSDDPAVLDRAMHRLGRLAHHIVWVNPRAAADGYQPIAAGMVTALPYCDHFLPGNTERAMGDVIDAITAA